MERTKIVRIIVSWLGRITAAMGLFLWGSFFVAHLHEWYITPIVNQTELPPWHVGLRMLLHFGFLLGYILGVKRELLGGLMVVICASAFFISLGPSKLIFWMYMLSAILPGLLYLAAWVMRKYKKDADNENKKAEQGSACSAF